MRGRQPFLSRTRVLWAAQAEVHRWQEALQGGATGGQRPGKGKRLSDSTLGPLQGKHGAPASQSSQLRWGEGRIKRCMCQTGGEL